MVTISDGGISMGDILSTAGTIVVAALAIWGRPIRAFLIRPKLTIAAHNMEGEPTHDTKAYYVYYHLKVVNERKWLPLKRCRVSLAGYSRKIDTGKFLDKHMAVPFQFTWSPADKFRVITITNEKVFDFIRLNTTSKVIEPVLYETPFSFAGRLSEGETVRYQVDVTSQNSYGNRTQFFEIHLKHEKWSKDPWVVRDYVTIKEVSALVD